MCVVHYFVYKKDARLNPQSECYVMSRVNINAPMHASIILPSIKYLCMYFVTEWMFLNFVDYTGFCMLCLVYFDYKAYIVLEVSIF